MAKCLLFTVFLVASLAGAQAPTVPMSAKSPEGFAPKGWKVVEGARAVGDLNGDGIADVAIAFDGPDPADPGDFRERLLVVAFGDGKGGYTRAASGLKAAGCQGCGGAKAPDSLQALKIERGVLVISQWGGSRWTWGVTDRWRFQEGAFVQIGGTHESLDTVGDEGQVIWDYNLNTGLVVEGRGDIEKIKTRVSYRVLRAGKVDTAPKLSEAWPGRALELGKDDLAAGVDAWKGKEDLSAKLWALVQGQDVWIKAEVQDDRVTEGDGLRFKDGRGRGLKAADIQKQPIPGGYLFRARLALAAVKKAGTPSFRGHEETEEAFALSVEVVDQDGPGRAPKRLSTSRKGQGVLLLTAEPGLPRMK